MKQNAAILLLALLAASPVLGQTVGASATSRSGQFIVFNTGAGHASAAVPDNSLVRLEPTLLAVSCERIKQALLATLNTPDQWRGKVRVVLHPFHAAGEDIVITSERFSDRWNYRMDLPDAIEPPRFVRALTQLLLLEMANRNTPDQSAQLPRWLAEGLPALVLARSDLELVLPAATPGVGNHLPSRTTIRDSRPANPLKQARECLGEQPPLNLAQLGQPPAETDADIYRCTATIFIHELLQLKNGGPCLAALLPELPWDPDWRVAFLRAFHSHFEREVDLAKWWSLQSTFIAGRTPAKTWTRAESLRKLDETLRCPLQVQLATNDEPFHTDVPLQAILQGWELPQQTSLLRDKMNQLSALRLRTASDLASLVEQYRRVLETYLQKSGVAGAAPAPHNPPPGGRHPASSPMKPLPAISARNPLLKDTLLQLDALDQRRESWHALLEKLPAAAPAAP
jgi:hypothetical protein